MSFTSLPNIAAAPTGQPGQGGLSQPAAMPPAGTPAGLPPVAAPAPMPMAAPEGTVTQNLLANYAKPDENDPNANKALLGTNPLTLQKAALPKAEAYGELAATMAGNAMPDPALTTAALGGDVEAFNQLLTGFATSILQQSLNSNTSVASSIAYGLAEQQQAVTADGMKRSAAHDTAIATAVSAHPELSQGRNAQFLDTVITELRARHPTAPAKLIGEQAALELRGSLAQVGAVPDQGTDWLAMTSG